MPGAERHGRLISFHDMTKRALKVALAAVCCAVLLALFYLYNPAECRFFIPCVFHSLTGLKCPGCGMQRAIHLLLRGRVADSFVMCPVLYFIPFVLLAMKCFPKATGRLWFGATVTAIVLCYGVLRFLQIVP